MTDLAISAHGLRKSYVDGIDLKVQVGTVVALLGPNGAGKATAVKTPSTPGARCRPGHGPIPSGHETGGGTRPSGYCRPRPAPGFCAASCGTSTDC